MGNRPVAVSIISRESNKKTRDIAMLEEELKRQGASVRVLSKLLTKDKSIKALGYIGHVVKQEAAILASDVVVLDTYCIPASMIPHRKGTKIVQMWHAVAALKQFGWQTVGKEGGSSEKTASLMKMHHGYDYVVCASDVTAKHFCEAFKVDSSKIVKYGLPRIDYIKSVTAGDRYAETTAKIYSKYPQMDPQTYNKTKVLYAPTFRKGKPVDLKSIVDAFDPEKYTVIVKLHPVYRNEAEVSAMASPDVIIDGSFTSNEWLSIADVVVSDYSSFVIESTLADKPLYIYAYDLDEYARSTGLNIDFDSEPIAPYVFGNAAALAACVEKNRSGAETYNMDALRAFRDRYIDINTDNCTADLAEFIMSLGGQ